MKYPSYEVRAPRTVFTKKLLNIADKLNKRNAGLVAYPKGRYWAAGEESVAILRMWVVGSYARGAMNCGDLDLLLEIEGDSYCSVATITTELLGKFRDVRFYRGTPEKNSSGVPFPDAKLVWEPGLDVGAAVEAICVDARAGRFVRESDMIPLRVEQLFMYHSQWENLLNLHREGVIEWSFVPLDAIEPVEIPTGYAERYIEGMGKDRQALASYVQGYFDRHPKASEGAPEVKGEAWTQGGVLVHLGRGSGVAVDDLDSPKFSEVCFMPFLNVRGPNGLWVIRRGPNHPLVMASAQMKGWVRTFDGKVSYASYSAHASYQEASVLNVFTTLEAFQADEDDWAADVPAGAPHEAATAVFLEGAAFLAALAGADGIEVDVCPACCWGRAHSMLVQDFGSTFIRGPELPELLLASLAGERQPVLQGGE